MTDLSQIRAVHSHMKALFDSRDSRKARPRWGMYDRRAAKAIIEAGATFFAAPGENETAHERGNIRQVVEWSKTTFGGKQRDLLNMETLACSYESRGNVGTIHGLKSAREAAKKPRKAQPARAESIEHYRKAMALRGAFTS